MVIASTPALPPAPMEAAASIVSSANPAPHGWMSHRIGPGETLSGIAVRYRTTAGTLAARNDLANPRHIIAGHTLLVPRPKSAATAASAAKPQAPARPAATHVVRDGDTLSGIAARYGVSLPTLLKANRISNPRLILPGQRIGIPGRTTTTKTAPATRAKAAVPDTFDGVRYPSKVAATAARNRATLAKTKVPTRTQTKALITATARAHGVDPTLALAIGWQESGWNHAQVSPANAIGIMQVIPAGGQWASDLVGRPLNLMDPKDNVTAGVVMLRALGKHTDSREEQIAAYYQGLGALQSRGMYDDTRRYVKNVLAIRARL